MLEPDGILVRNHGLLLVKATMNVETTNPNEITKKTRSSHSSRASMTFLFLLVVPNADQSTSFTS